MESNGIKMVKSEGMKVMEGRRMEMKIKGMEMVEREVVEVVETDGINMLGRVGMKEWSGEEENGNDGDEGLNWWRAIGWN